MKTKMTDEISEKLDLLFEEYENGYATAALLREDIVDELRGEVSENVINEILERVDLIEQNEEDEKTLEYVDYGIFLENEREFFNDDESFASFSADDEDTDW